MSCRANAVVRPGFRPLSILLMVIGFLIAWPLGLAMLAWMIWGDRLAGFADGVRRGFHEAAARHGFTPGRGFSSCGAGPFASTGNSAFDAYRETELERLERERRRLDEERREFEAHLARLRRARDQQEFDRFRAERAARDGRRD
jgi:hypothetical protein